LLGSLEIFFYRNYELPLIIESKPLFGCPHQNHKSARSLIANVTANASR